MNKKATGLPVFSQLSGRGDGLFSFQCFFPLPRPDTPGLVRLMTQLLGDGPKGMRANRLYSRLGANGCDLRVSTSDLGWSISVEGRSEGAGVARELLGRLLLAPAFRKEAFRRERSRQIAAIREQDDNPLYYAFRLMRQRCFADPLIAHGSLGTIESLVRLRRSELVDFFKKEQCRDVLVGWAGDDKGQGEAWHQFACKFWHTQAVVHSAPSPLAAPWHEVLRLPGKGEQAVVQLGFAGPGLEESTVLSVLSSALSAMDGPLFREVREKRGLAYSVGVRPVRAVGGTAVVVFASCEPAKVDEVIKVLRGELERVSQQGLCPLLFEGTCKSFGNRFQRQRDSIGGRVGLAMGDLFFGREGKDGDGIVRELSRLQLTDIKALATNVFQRGSLGDMVLA